MPEDLWLLFLFVLMGAGTWLLERNVQREERYCSEIVKAPPLVNLLCGNPRGDGTIDLGCGVRQLSSLAFALGAPLIFLLPLDLSRRAGLVFLGYVIISIPGFALTHWLRWRHGHRLARESNGASSARSAR